MNEASLLSLGPYVPRVVREWLDDDVTARHRRIAGTVVFVDVSGFTRMSERLARFGKVGAESVTDVIGTCFNRLLTEAYALGATLLKFGGDALLLFFEGTAHEMRGCAAALEMRRALREMGAFETRAGRVTLRMSVGVHSGEFDFFLVGESHRELIIAGRASTDVVEMEASAGTGRILASGAAVASIPRANRGSPSGPGYLLRGSPPVEGHTEVRFLEVAQDLSPYVPLALREVLTGTGVQPEHRRVTIAFVRFGGVDSLIERAGPDVSAQAIDDLIRAVQRAVDPHGVCFLGTDIAPDGGKVILISGAPTSVGEDDEQMLLALRAFVDSQPALPVRIGVNGGHVFVGEIGTVHRRTYTVMGDAVNVAARLMAKAHDGQILATPPVLHGSRTLFESSELAPFAVKGKREPVIAFAVGAPRGVRAGIASSDLPLVGRDTEMATLLAAVDFLHLGSGRFVEVVGEPGIGKSRFVDEVLARANGVPVHRVQCRQYEAATPYFAVRDLLRELLGLAGKTDADMVAGLVQLIHSTVPSVVPFISLIAIPLALEYEESPEVALLAEEFRKQQLERSMVELLSSLMTHPAILCFEDTHWMDEASGDLVRALERELNRLPWLLCVTRRPVPTGFIPEAGPRTITVGLTALGAESIVGLLEAATVGEPLAAHLVRSLAQRSDGNPLFALELLHAFQVDRDLEALPQSVEGLIAARIDRLSADDRSMLRHVSVLGAGFQDQHILAVLPDTDRASLTASLARLGDLVERQPSGWVTFRHALVRDVAYAALPFGLRSRLHGRVAESILLAANDDDDDQAALLSLHFVNAQCYADAWRFARLAAISAAELFANIEAITLYQRALHAARHLPDLAAADRVDTLERLGDVQDLAGLYDDARASYRAARRLRQHDPVRHARLMLKDAFVIERTGHYSGAIRSIRRGQRLLDGIAGQDAAQLSSQLTVWYAVVRANQGKAREAARWSRAGIELAESSGDEAALARAYIVLGWAEGSVGLSDGTKHTAHALEISIRLGDLSGQATALNNLGVRAYYHGRWGQAIELYGRSREARLKAGDPVNAAMADANTAEIYADQGRLDDAKTLWHAAAAVWAAAGDRWGMAFANRGLGLVAARSGRFDEAVALLADAKAAFSAIRAYADVLSTSRDIVESLVLAGAGGSALALLDEVQVDREMSDCLPLHRPALHRLRGLALLQTGATELGRRELDAAVTAARRQNDPYQLALALETLDRLSGDDQDTRPEYIEILDRLGVISRPKYPMPSTTRLPITRSSTDPTPVRLNS